ncbi:MAG: dTDP-4-dehydrorhamnose 3,5-epimerase [Rhodomicrobium sp.]
MSRFSCHSTALQGLLAIGRKPIEDERGFFSRFFCREEFAALGFSRGIAQINHTLTRLPGSIRGMHFQRAPHEETKVVSCIAGAVFDVAVDMRRGSPTYLQWHGEVLSAENSRSMLIPRGFAHGFQTLSENCQLLYLHDEPYAPGFERGLNALDPRLAIAWPLPAGQMSERDQAFAMIDF